MMPFYTDSRPALENQDRRLLHAARTDNVELLNEVFAKPGEYNINFQDG